jgi:hypothetical protein
MPEFSTTRRGVDELFDAIGPVLSYSLPAGNAIDASNGALTVGQGGKNQKPDSPPRSIRVPESHPMYPFCSHPQAQSTTYCKSRRFYDVP